MTSTSTPRFGSDAARPALELLEAPHWYALRTRARAEKTTDRLLTRVGVESFAAIAEVERQWADRTRRVRMPLFSGYIFVRIPLQRITDVLCWPGAVELVKHHGVPCPLRDEDIQAVMQLARGISETGAMPEEVDSLQPGDRVRVKEGPFRGMEGTLVEARSSTYVAVRIEMIRQAKAVHVDRALLVKVGAGAA